MGIDTFPQVKPARIALAVLAFLLAAVAAPRDRADAEGASRAYFFGNASTNGWVTSIFAFRTASSSVTWSV